MYRKSLCVVALFSCLASNAFADDEVNYKTDKLTGDWNGSREKLAASGVDITITDRVDIFGNLAGGIKQGATGFNNVDVIFTIDGEKLAGLKGTSGFVDILDNRGGHPDAKFVGSAQGYDNFEVPENTTQIYQAWLQQNLFDNKLSLLAGIYDVNSEFYVTDSSLLFIHSAYGIGSEMALTGPNGPSIFPYTGLAARVKVQPVENVYVEAAALDGYPGSRNHMSGTHIGVHEGEGALWVGEAGYMPGGEHPSGKFGIGGWYYSEKMPTNADPSVNKRNQGMYVIGEHKLYSEKGSKDKGLAGFVRIGFADEDVNRFDYSWATGVVYTGFFAGRDEGQLGFGVNGVHSASSYRTANGPLDTAETAVELTYADKLTPWFTIQPDVQYIVNPGTDPALDNAFILGARAIVEF